MISVCMATYNGEQYISEQIDSILAQLTDDSELIISDDGSSDNTVKIIKSYKDERIRLIHGPQNGVVKNFENAILHAKGEYIFLSDQDDVWMSNKVSTIMKCFENSRIECVLHDAIVVDGDRNEIMPSFFEWRKVKHGLLNNIVKNSYTGCCMAITKGLISKALPFPEGIEMHDWWLGLISEKTASSFFLDNKLILYRRHSNNTNSLEGYPLLRKITNRMTFIKALLALSNN